jgi:outer membrane protein assembly factor BamB
MRGLELLRRPRPGVVIAALGVFVATGTAAGTAIADTPDSTSTSPEGSFNQPGNVLIADQFNNRVVELDAENDVVWQFGIGPNDVSARSIVGTNDAERIGTLTLMAGTGVPAANPPLEPNCPNGCVDNRVILVNQSGQIVWQYGHFGVTGSGPDQLNTPVQNTYLPNGDILITDQGNERVIEVNTDHQIVWQYGMTGVVGNGADQLSNPNSAELLPNGHILIADENNNRAIEVTRTHQIVHMWSGVYAGQALSGVAFASRLPNGNTLLTDSNNNRVLEISPSNQVVWSYTTNLQSGSNTAPLPTRAIRLRNGDTLISDQFNNRVIEVDHGSPASIIRQWGTSDALGFGRNAFNGPYDAKVIGDYTGLTFP